jgi:hypothetical protein
MPVYLDESIAHHPKFVRAGPAAFGLFVAGLCYCGRYRTHGLIPKVAVPFLLPGVGRRRALELAERLAANGPPPSWIDEGDGFRVHDYEVFQVSCEVEREQPMRSGNAERQRRFRQRSAARGEGRQEATGDPRAAATGDATLGATPSVARDVMPGRRDVTHGVTRYVTPGVTREVTPRARHVTRDVPRGVTPDRNGKPTGVTPCVTGGGRGDITTPDGHGDMSRDGEAQAPAGVVGSPSGPFPPVPAACPSPPLTPPPPFLPPLPPLPLRPEVTAVTRTPGLEELDRAAGFAAWYAAFPRQEGEAPARRAWRRARELPPLPELLARLAVQKAAKPEAAFWPAPERYLRERRWRDTPPPAPAARPRSADAERRALGSDESRRQRLREISERARFDPDDAGEGDA